MTFQRKCDECGKDFEAKKSNAKYCGSTCRSRASVRRSLGAIPDSQTAAAAPPIVRRPEDEESPEIKRQAIPTPPASDVASQFIIGLLQKEADRFEAAYNKERDVTRELRRKNEELAEKIRQADLDKRIAEAKGPEKSSLQGLMESPVIQGLLPFIGPAIQEGASALVKKATAAQQQGAAPQVAGLDENTPIGQFMIWLSGKPQDVQGYVLEVIQGLMSIEGDLELMQRLLQVRDHILGQYMRAV